MEEGKVMNNRVEMILKYTKKNTGLILDIDGGMDQQEQCLLQESGFEYKSSSLDIQELKRIEDCATGQEIVAVYLSKLGSEEENFSELVKTLAHIMKKSNAFLFLHGNKEKDFLKFKVEFSQYGEVFKCNPFLDNFFDGDLNNTLFSKGTLVNQYFNWLDATVGSNTAEELYIGICDEKEIERRPFLSVVTRTQGRRPEALRETLLGLSAQTDDDFEVILIGHKLDEAQEKLVKEIIEETPKSLRDKIRFVKLDKGNRTTPINEGFSLAAGIYAVILDDDDVVFDNWVEEFKKQYEKTPGAVLHAYAIAQEWMTIESDSEEEALRACGSPMSIYCKKFNWLTELYNNICPPVGLAFPVYPFKKWGIVFDETLDTTEDWDYLMRVGFLCGIADIKNPTCIYRLWVNAESSHTVHSEELWLENHRKILKKFEDVPIILPKGYSNKVNVFIQSKGSNVEGGNEDGILLGEKCPLYLDFGKGFSEKNAIREGGEYIDGKFKYIYTLPDERIYNLRWDPTESKDKLIDKLSIQLEDSDGNVYKVADRDIKTNGVNIKNQICFYKNDPQIVFKCKGEKGFVKVYITGIVKDGIPDEYFDLLVGRMWKNILKRHIKQVYHKIKGYK